MARPDIAAIVSCYNLGRYLPETLASIRAQTYPASEICVVDDGSTDPETRDVLSALGSDVRVVRSPNRGLPAARNRGLAETRAPIVCAVDADDILLPELFAKSVARLEADPSLAFVSHWLETFGDESWSWTPVDCTFPALLAANTINGAALVRRSALDAVGGWDETMRNGLEDWDLWIALVARGFRGAIVPEVLFRYRRRADSMSRAGFSDGGHARLYGALVEKHATTFREHLTDLVAWREADMSRLQVRADDLDERLEMDILPTARRAQDDLEDARRRRSQWERHAELERLRAHAEQLRVGAERLGLELQSLHAHAGNLTRALEHAQGEVTSLRASLSWRMTAPLRALASRLQRTDS